MSSNEKLSLFKPSVGKRGMTELHYAAYCGDKNEMTRQLDAGSDPDAKDDYRGYAAIHWLADMAATGGPRVQMLRLLAARNANLQLQANNGETALSLAIAAGSVTGEQLAAELVSLGAQQ